MHVVCKLIEDAPYEVRVAKTLCERWRFIGLVLNGCSDARKRPMLLPPVITALQTRPTHSTDQHSHQPARAFKSNASRGSNAAASRSSTTVTLACRFSAEAGKASSTAL